MRRILLTATGLALFAGLFGCLERKETIHVAPDGAVAMRIEISGDPADFDSGDRLPERDSAWRAVDRMETEPGSDKQKRVRTAEREFRPHETLPDAYVESHNEWHEVALHFPTSVTIEKRRDGTYYHFRRTYVSRPEARYSVVKELHGPLFEEIKGFAGKPAEELSADERAKLVSVLLVTEMSKQVEFMQAGVDAMKERWPQDYGLMIRQELVNHYDRIKPADVADLLAEPQSEERDSKINRLGERALAEGREAIEKLLRSLDVSSREIDQFFAAVAVEEDRRLVTEDIGDENWQVRVQLPGTIIATNATNIEDGSAVWEFPGKCMYDRDQVLMATSRVERGE